MQEHHPTISADEALRRLVDGNERFLNGTTRWNRVTVAALTTLADRQEPYATILGCSDSRVPPELVFDTGVGELFVVRVAGSVFSGEVAGTLQYAVVHLGTPLVVVLGHSGCGAVEAALEARRAGATHESGLRLLVESVLPALEDVDPSLPLDAQMLMAVEHNVRWTLRRIAETEQGRQRLRWAAQARRRHLRDHHWPRALDDGGHVGHLSAQMARGDQHEISEQILFYVCF